MSTLADLDRAVQATLASKRLGRPVFVRCTLQGPEKPPAIRQRLAEAATMVGHWIGHLPERLYAVAGPGGEQVALTLQFRDGATALVSFAGGMDWPEGIDVMVLGNRGALYHDVGAGVLWDAKLGRGAHEVNKAIQVAIERALRSGKPEPVGKGANP